MDRRILNFQGTGNRKVNNSSERVNSDSNPVAQSPGLCALRDELFIEKTKVQRWLEFNTEQPRWIKAVISLLFDYGLRISEVLSIKATDIGDNGLIHIKGAKGSQDRFIVPTSYRDIIIDKKLTFCANLRLIDRFHIYRLCRRYGFYFVTDKKKNNKVTHYFRYLYMNYLRLSDLNEAERAAAVGHKNKNSQTYYYEKKIKGI